MNQEFELKSLTLQELFINETHSILKQYNQIKFESLHKDKFIQKLIRIIQDQEHVISVINLVASDKIYQMVKMFRTAWKNRHGLFIKHVDMNLKVDVDKISAKDIVIELKYLNRATSRYGKDSKHRFFKNFLSKIFIIFLYTFYSSAE